MSVSRLPPLRAPVEDGGVLAVPALAEAGRLIAENRERLSRIEATLLDRPWRDLRILARRELLQAARRYTNKPEAQAEDHKPLLLAGHQPELFHPGVWIKNFALAALARRHDAIGVQFLVDNDTLKSTSLLFPTPGDPWPEARTLPFDRWEGETPWEERRILDATLFDRFGDDGTALLAGWHYTPLLTTFWPEVRRQASNHDGLLGATFAAARRTLERRWGCDNLEVPLSHLCRTEAFAWLAGTLLADLPRFVATYNAAVQAYRRSNRIRSRHHPVPDLASEGDWLEAPLWGWKASHPRRARLFARLTADRLELRAGQEAWPVLPSPTTQPGRFVEAWRELETTGYKVRSRALITTLFARLFLSDLFLHGIGGGKYDELTDRIIERYWNLPTPSFLVLTATCRLPLPGYAVSASDQRRWTHLVRDLNFNPQRHLSAPPSPDLEAAVHAKQEWIAHIPDTRSQRRERFRQLRHLSASLRPAVADELARAQHSLSRIERQLQANALLHRRDYSFCLHPERTLRRILAPEDGNMDGTPGT